MQFLECSFEGVEFPVESFTVDGGNDGVDHTAYLRRGADIEPTGLRAYGGTLEVPLLDTAPLVARYGNLSEAKRFDLLNVLETTPIGVLIHPTMGRFRAFMADWKESGRSEERNGTRLTLVWREHNGEASLLLSDTGGPPQDAPATVTTRAAAADAAATSLASTRGAAVSGYVPVSTAITAGLAALDGATLGYAATTSTLGAMLSPVAANLALPSLAALDAHALRMVLLDLRTSLNLLRSRYMPSQTTVRYYVTPQVMSVTDIAVAVYGDASRTGALYTANAFPDPLFVPAGRRVTVIPATP